MLLLENMPNQAYRMRPGTMSPNLSPDLRP
jgi:hypothetical protein